MNDRLLHLAILTSQFLTAFGAIVTLSSFVEVTETLPPGGVPPTASKPQPEATATSKIEHTTTQDTAQPHKTDTLSPPVAPPSTTAEATFQSTSPDIISSTTDSGHPALISVTTNPVPSSTLSSSATQSPKSGLSSPSATASPNADNTVNKGTIIGGVSGAGAVLIALIIAAFFWWRRRKRGQDAPRSGSSNHNRDNIPDPTNNYRKSILKAKSKFNMFNHAKDSDEASVTSFKSRGMGSLFRSYSRGAQSVPRNVISISAPMPHPGHDTLVDISKGPYESASQQASSPAPPVPPNPAYFNQTASNRVSTMSVIQEYSPMEAAFPRSTEYNDDDKSPYNQGYPMTRLPSSPRLFSRRPPRQSPRSSRTRSHSLHRSQMTAFPGDSDPYTSMHEALGNASYVPPVRPAVNTKRNNDNHGYRESIYSEYTDIRYDPGHRATHYPY